jgi:hypothetical protein
MIDELNRGSSFTEVVACPAKYDKQGRLRVRGYHREPPACPTDPVCPDFMCKGTALLAMLDDLADPRPVIYIGDSTGDLCACLALRPQDHVFARANMSLHTALVAEAEKAGGGRARATLHTWDSAQDLLEGLQALVHAPPATTANRKSGGSKHGNTAKKKTSSSSRAKGKRARVGAAGNREDAGGLSERPEGRVKLKACRHCKRTFNEDRVARHEAICKKNADSDKKRKKTRAAHSPRGPPKNQTDADMEEARRLYEANRKQRERAERVAAQKKKNWRAKHEEFQATVRAARSAR